MVRSGGDGGKTQSGDVERRGGGAIHHATLRCRAKPYRAKRHHSSRRYERPCHAIPCRRCAIPCRRCACRRRRHLAPAPALQSMQRRLRSPLRDKPICLCSWRAPKDNVAPTKSGTGVLNYSMNGELNFAISTTADAANLMNNNSCARDCAFARSGMQRNALKRRRIFSRRFAGRLQARSIRRGAADGAPGAVTHIAAGAPTSRAA